MNGLRAVIRGELLFVTIVKIIGCLFVHNNTTNYSIARIFSKMQ